MVLEMRLRISDNLGYLFGRGAIEVLLIDGLLQLMS